MAASKLPAASPKEWVGFAAYFTPWHSPRPCLSIPSQGSHVYNPPCSSPSIPCVLGMAMVLVGSGTARPALEKASHGLTNLRLSLVFHHSQVRQSSRCPSLGQLPNPISLPHIPAPHPEPHIPHPTPCAHPDPPVSEAFGQKILFKVHIFSLLWVFPRLCSQ